MKNILLAFVNALSNGQVVYSDRYRGIAEAIAKKLEPYPLLKLYFDRELDGDIEPDEGIRNGIYTDIKAALSAKTPRSGDVQLALDLVDRPKVVPMVSPAPAQPEPQPDPLEIFAPNDFGRVWLETETICVWMGFDPRSAGIQFCGLGKMLCASFPDLVQNRPLEEGNPSNRNKQYCDSHVLRTVCYVWNVRRDVPRIPDGDLKRRCGATVADRLRRFRKEIEECGSRWQDVCSKLERRDWVPPDLKVRLERCQITRKRA